MSSSEHYVLEAKNIHKSFASLEVLKGVDLQARKGDVISILGASGSGKSTFLRCLNCLEIPEQGEILLNGEALQFNSMSGRIPRQIVQTAQLAHFRSQLAMVFQGFNLWAHMTCLENIIEAPIHVLGLERTEAISAAEHWLSKVGMFEKRDSYPIQLSGGQQQRIGIARALAMRPEVILFDEPTSALDPELVGEVLKIIQALAEEGRTMIIVTHEIQFAREVSDKIIFLHQGQVEELASPEHFFTQTQSLRVKQFLSRYSGV